MKIFATRHKLATDKNARSSKDDDRQKRARIAGNAFFALFAAVAMLGAVGYGFNTVLRGPITGMTDVSRRTVAESTLVTSSRLAIVGATTHQASGGDCDADGMIEPLPYFNAGTAPHPTNGGWLPRGAGPPAWTLVPTSIDPWNTEYGYCAWDSGSVVAAAGCGGATGRLAGSPSKNVQSFVIISAGKNKKFETTCTAYSAGTPNAVLYTKPAGSDDIVLPYTYAEANDVGNGLWKGTNTPATTVAATDKSLQVKGSGTFAAPVTMTGGGLVLPDQTSTGACNAINDKQLRRNMTDPANPVIEICDFTNGLDWSSISGAASGGGGGGGNTDTGILTGTQLMRLKLDESSGTTAFDSRGSNNATLYNAPTWAPTGGQLGGALTFNGTNQYIKVKDSPYLRPSALTLTMWVKSAGVQQSNATLLDKPFKNGAPGQYLTFAMGQDGGTQGLINFQVGSVGTFDYGYWDAGGYRLPTNQWVFLVAIVNPSATSGDAVKLYADGVVKGGIASIPPISYDTTVGENDIYIGNGKNVGPNSWNGGIDDVRMYNYAMSETEMLALYNSAKSGISTPGPVKQGPIYSMGYDTSGASGNGPSFGASTTGAPQAVLSTSDYVQVSGGNGHACGVKANGTIWCWGENGGGALGNAAVFGTDQQSPVKVDNITNAIKVAMGEFHSCALKSDGTIWCWGDAYYGELGNGQNLGSYSPVQVNKISDFIDVGVNARSSCGIRANGTLWCWGQDSNGGLGCNNCGSQNEPVQVKDSAGTGYYTDWTSIGENSTNNLNSMCGVTKRGIGYCWGPENSGSFGNGATSSDRPTPSQISNITDFVKLSTGEADACGLRATGQIACWGNDSLGQLGNGPTPNTNQNVPYTIPNISDFVDVSTSYNNACGLRRNGDVYCWGNNYTDTPISQGGPFSSLGGGRDASYQILSTGGKKSTATLSKDKEKLTVGSVNGCLIDLDKTAWCWGDDTNGQLGNGATTGQQNSPSAVSNPGPWMQIATAATAGTPNAANTCAIKENGALYCWGPDGSGQVGNGGVTGTQVSPYLVGAATDTWAQVSVGKLSVCAISILHDGALYCWGADGNKTNAGIGAQTSPTAIADAGPWLRISKGNNNTTCAIKAAGDQVGIKRGLGDAYCWGLNTNGQVGIGGTSTADVAVPTLVASDGPWIDISAGRSATCGVKANGTLWCWGDAAVHKQFGDPFKPILVNDSGPWSTVSVYDTHVCGTKMDGSGWCFGTYNVDGRQGNGVTADTAYPTRVYGGNDWSVVKAGSTSSCGLKNDGSAWCWGADGTGQLGNGAAAASTTPSRVALYQKPAAFTYNSNGTSFSPPSGINLNIGTTRYVSNNGAAATGLHYFGTGLSTIVQPASTTGTQLMLDTIGNNASAQLNFKGNSVLATQDNIPGLISRWKLDEPVGSTVANDSISGNNGTVNGAPTFNVTGSGSTGTALTFANSGVQYLRVTRNTSFEPSSQAVTVSAWVKRNGASDNLACPFAKQHTNDDGGYYISYALCFNGTTTNVAFYTTNSSVGAGDYLLSTGTIPNATWTLITVTYDAYAAAPQKKIYINGVLDSSKTWSTPMIYDTTSGGDVTIGAGTPTSGSAFYQRFFGSLDDIRYYARALTPTEVQKLYAAYTPGTNMMRTVGLDYVSGNLEFTRNITGSDQWAQNIPVHDMEIDNGGNVGIGTTGQPVAKLDVNGAIRIGHDSAGCSVAKQGTLDYNSGAWRYCTSAGSWATWGSFNSDLPWLVGDRMLGGDGNNFCGVKQDGYMYCWGEAGNGALGNNTTTPNLATPVKVHDSATSAGWNDWVAVGTILGIRSNGTMWGWGDNSYGYVGNNNNPTNALRPSQVKDTTGSTSFSDWVAISANGHGVKCGIRTNGRLYCWGYNYYGPVGDGSNTHRMYPVSVLDSTGVAGTFYSDWKMVATNQYISCGLRRNGSAYCWGDQQNGGLGNGTTSGTTIPYPQRVRDGSGTAAYWSDWVYIASGGRNSCGIRSNGRLYCWGTNAVCLLGNDCATGDRNYPTEVYNPDGTTNADNVPANSAITDWVMVSMGDEGADNHYCALRASGALYCWGQNTSGHIGDGTTTLRTYPTQVKNNTGSGVWTDWVNVVAAQDSTCGQRSNGTTWCWGAGTLGQLGNGAFANSSLPVQVK